MASEEKSAWIMLVLAIVSCTTYVIWVLSGVGSAPLTEAPFVAPMFWTIGGSIIASIVLHIFFAPRMVKKDQRDRDIHRFGEYQSFGFVTVGALAAMVMAAFQFDTFWIANVLYLGFILSAIVGAIAKLVAYRSGLPQW